MNSVNSAPNSFFDWKYNILGGDNHILNRLKRKTLTTIFNSSQDINLESLQVCCSDFIKQRLASLWLLFYARQELEVSSVESSVNVSFQNKKNTSCIRGDCQKGLG